MNNHSFTIDYSVHTTPLRPGQTRPSFHVRHEQREVVHTRELQEKVARDGMMTEGTFVLVVETLKEEIVRQLLMGHGVHIDGLGRFALQLRTRKPADAYQRADELTANEVLVDGVTFMPDMKMLSNLQSAHRCLNRRDNYRQEVTRDHFLAVLADYCRSHEWFTRRTVQFLLSLSRYKASLLLSTLCAEEHPPIVRQLKGTTWVYQLA